MKSNTAKKTDYPFYFPGAGIAAARKTMTMAVCFVNEPDEATKKQITASHPKPFDSEEWYGKCLLIGHESDSLQWVVAASYESSPTEPGGDVANSSQWKAFNEDIDKWLLAIHALSPLYAVVRLIDMEYETEVSPWHIWSMEHVDDYAVTLLQILGEENDYYLEVVALMWVDGYLYNQSFDEQKKILKSLSETTHHLLELYYDDDIAPKDIVTDTRPIGPTLEEAMSVWEKVKKEDDPCTSFTKHYEAARYKYDRIFDIFGLVNLYLDNKMWSKVVELCDIALSSKDDSEKAEDDRKVWWRPFLAKAYIHLGEFEKAHKNLSEALLHFMTYQDQAVHSLLEWYEAKGDKENAAIVYHGAGRAYSAYFEIRQYKKPKDVEKKFDALLDEWWTPVWHPESFSKDTLDDLEYLITKISDYREVLWPHLRKRLEEIRKQNALNQEKAVSLFKNDPEALEEKYVPYILDELNKDPDLVLVDRAVPALLKTFPSLKVRQSFAVLQKVADKKPDDFLLAWSKIDTEKLLKSWSKSQKKSAATTLARVAYALAEKAGHFKEALAVYDFLIQITDIGMQYYFANALWAVMNDNNKMPIDPVRERKYLEAALPFGPEDPTIYHNAACIYYELGEKDMIYEAIALAKKNNYKAMDKIKAEPMFASFQDDPKFIAAFK